MTGTPWSDDDDIAADVDDLPPGVAENVAHAPPPSTDEHGIRDAVIRAHLEKALDACGNQMRALRAAIESLG
jgi:hypothetical protein